VVLLPGGSSGSERRRIGHFQDCLTGAAKRPHGGRPYVFCRFCCNPGRFTGAEDPDSRAHGPNESIHLGDFENAILAVALLLARLNTPE
jgi:hypothetical protein